MEMKRSLVLAFAILLLITGSVLVSAITGSMGNARMILYPEVNGWTNTIVEKSIAVSNVNDIAINVTLVPDSNGTKFLEVIDKSFILQPGEDMKAQFNVKVKKEGTYEGRINVFFKPENGTEGGVVLSSTIIVIARKDQGYTDNTNTNTDTNTDDNTNSTGDNTNTGNGNTETGLPKGVLIWGIVIIFFILVLLVLLYILSQKRNKSKKRKHKYR